MSVIRHYLLLIALSSLCACGDGRERTIKVLSTRDDSPVPDVNIEVRAVATLGDLALTTDMRVWELTTDAAGEVHVTPPVGTTLEVYVSGKPGFTPSNVNIKSYEMHQGPKSERKRGTDDTYYLTPTIDVDYEWVRFAFRSASDVVDGKVNAPGKPIVHLVNMYSQAKKHAETQRELLALREFCRFTEMMKVEAMTGWPTLGTSVHFVSWGEMLIRDCETPSETSIERGEYELPAIPQSGPQAPETIKSSQPESPNEAAVRPPPIGE